MLMLDLKFCINAVTCTNWVQNMTSSSLFVPLCTSALRPGHVMEWNGMEDGMEEEFWYGIWKTSGMERNGRF